MHKKTKHSEKVYCSSSIASKKSCLTLGHHKYLKTSSIRQFFKFLSGRSFYCTIMLLSYNKYALNQTQTQTKNPQKKWPRVTHCTGPTRITQLMNEDNPDIVEFLFQLLHEPNKIFPIYYLFGLH